MPQDPFDLMWIGLFIFACMSAPIIIGLVAVLTERD
jgi:hypothetical protein